MNLRISIVVYKSIKYLNEVTGAWKAQEPCQDINQPADVQVVHRLIIDEQHSIGYFGRVSINVLPEREHLKWYLELLLSYYLSVIDATCE